LLSIDIKNRTIKQVDDGNFQKFKTIVQIKKPSNLALPDFDFIDSMVVQGRDFSSGRPLLDIKLPVTLKQVELHHCQINIENVLMWPTEHVLLTNCKLQLLRLNLTLSKLKLPNCRELSLKYCTGVDVIDFKHLQNINRITFADTSQDNLLAFYYQLRQLPSVNYVHIYFPVLNLQTLVGFLTNSVLMAAVKKLLIFTVSEFALPLSKLTDKDNFPGLHKSVLKDIFDIKCFIAKTKADVRMIYYMTPLMENHTQEV